MNYKREIKFRAWDKKAEPAGRMLDISLAGYTLFNYLTQDRYEVMQFTGLKDKNGVEIFEGDICNTPNGVRLVTYGAPSFWLAVKENDTVDVDAFSTPNIYEEVIGNIMENPELLK
jgi:uncharacterized phage protein (TIGR01671 family)